MDGKLLFNARAESITDANFWRSHSPFAVALFEPTVSSSGRKLSRVRSRNLSSLFEIQQTGHPSDYRETGSSIALAASPSLNSCHGYLP
jgi:hypothetical protein